MAHLHSVHEEDIYFTIDPITREIIFDSEDAILLSQTDHNSEVFTFELPRYIEGHDMMLCNLVQAHYINLSSDSRTKRNMGLYEITDLHVDPEDEERVICSWLVSSNATMFVGSLSFTLRFACMSGSKVDYSWNTTVFSSVAVLETISNVEYVTEQYPDVLQAWYLELLSAGDTGVNIVAEATDNALTEVDIAKTGAINSINSAKTGALNDIEGAGSRQKEVFDEAVETVEQANKLADELQAKLDAGDFDGFPLEEIEGARHSVRQTAEVDEVNTVLAKSAVSFGKNNIAGCLGYYFTEMYYGSSTENPQIRLSDVQPVDTGYKISTSPLSPNSSFVKPNYDIGDVFNILCNDHFALFGTITNIVNDVITFTGDINFFKAGLNTQIGLGHSKIENGYYINNVPKFDDYTLAVPTKPLNGIVPVCETVTTSGTSNITAGSFGDSHGKNTKVVDSYGHTTGKNTLAGYAASAEGDGSQAPAKYSHAQNKNTKSLGYASTSMGVETEAHSDGAVSTGYNTKAHGPYSFTGGNGTKTTAEAAVSLGKSTLATAMAAFAEGLGVGGAFGIDFGPSEASGVGSHVEGIGTKASHEGAHAENFGTTASGKASHSGGLGSLASGYAAFVHGMFAEARGDYSAAFNYYTIATCAFQTVIGKYNAEDPDALFIVGGGTSESDRKNLFAVTEKGIKLSNIQYGTEDLTVGVSELPEGVLYFVYE